MSDISSLPHKLDATARTCRAVIETPKGRRAKYAFDHETKAFELKAMLPDGMSFPMDFGFIPSTWAEDGDPLDVLVLNDEPGTVGTLVNIRLIGVIEAEQTEEEKTERNDRLIAVATASHLYEKLERIDQLGESFVDHLAQFFVNYNALRNRRFKVLGVQDPERAVELVNQASQAAKTSQ